jgi:hypothetical protein
MKVEFPRLNLTQFRALNAFFSDALGSADWQPGFALARLWSHRGTCNSYRETLLAQNTEAISGRFEWLKNHFVFQIQVSVYRLATSFGFLSTPTVFSPWAQGLEGNLPMACSSGEASHYLILYKKHFRAPEVGTTVCGSTRRQEYETASLSYQRESDRSDSLSYS